MDPGTGHVPTKSTNEGLKTDAFGLIIGPEAAINEEGSGGNLHSVGLSAQITAARTRPFSTKLLKAVTIICYHSNLDGVFHIINVTNRKLRHFHLLRRKILAAFSGIAADRNHRQ